MTGDVRIAAAALEEFTQAVFVRVGVPSEDAALEAKLLVWANLRGVDSHGVLRIPWYVEMLERGDMNGRPNIRVEKETPATLLIDGDQWRQRRIAVVDELDEVFQLLSRPDVGGSEEHAPGLKIVQNGLETSRHR